MWVLSLSIPHGMHLAVPTHPYFFWAVCHPSRIFPPEEPEQESQNRFFPLPTARPCPLTSNWWPHDVLYWLCIGWWCLSLTCTSLLCMSKICSLLMHLPWSGGSSTQSAIRPWLLMVWVVLRFPILLWLAPLKGWALFDGGFCLLSAYSFTAIISCHTILSFLLWCYLTQSCWTSLGLPFILLQMAQYGHWFFYYITCEF